MKIDISKTVDMGRVTVTLSVNGEKDTYGRLATGHTSGPGREAVALLQQTDPVTLSYGEYSKTFQGLPRTSSADDMRKKIVEVRDWVNKCKQDSIQHSWTHSFELPEI